MKITVYLHHVENEPYIVVSQKIMDLMGWKDEETLELDIPTTHKSLLIFKKGPKDV